MAILHIHASVISRSNGHSAIAAGAYQARENLTDEQQRFASTTIDLDDTESKKQFSLDKRTLTKGEISDSLRQEFSDNGIELSDNVTVTRDNRRQWTVTDDDKSFTVKEYRKTTSEKYTDENDKTKRKQTVIGQGLDISGKKNITTRTETAI